MSRAFDDYYIKDCGVISTLEVTQRRTDSNDQFIILTTVGKVPATTSSKLQTMVDSAMDAARIIGYFKDKTILVTGSTGFLGKILVEKILRVQPAVRRIYLLVRAADEPSAQQRVQQEVTGTELFSLLRDKYGEEGFDLFIRDKIVPLAGDITNQDLGLEPTTLDGMAKEMDVIVNVAATTNFYERYDVALDVNVMGVKHLCHLAKHCANRPQDVHACLHWSVVGVLRPIITYVSGDGSTEPILEKPIKPGEALRGGGTRVDVDSELRLASDAKNDLTTTSTSSGAAERKAMKELGLRRARHFGWSNTYVFTKAMGEMVLEEQLRRGGDGDGGSSMPPPAVVVMRPSIITSVRADPVPGWVQGTRTIDTLIVGYAKRSISAFLADLRLVMDVIPADMVVNAMLAAAVAHSGSGSGSGQDVVVYYQPTSSLRNPVTYAVLYRSGSRHFREHPRVRDDGEAIPNKEMRFFTTIPRFRLYMILSYKLPLEMLHMANLLLCGLFSKLYKDSNRKYKFVMHLVDVYGPFAFFKGCFDDTNMERLRSAMVMSSPEDDMFNYDPRTIDWDDYFYRIHIPGVLKYVCK
ncbi:putative fatty acyl-CoA reductase 4 [Zea mays]|uniref:Fatty acyl-CoA reductase n=1 Tax=Zea mays TaxID=4577 RepID=A0A317Y6E0_MAIZE|nr:putative fatty acyl-CoA reductase 4 [Zea mays]